MSEPGLRARGPLRQPAPTRHGQLRQSRPWATALKWVASAVAVMLVSGACIATVAVWNVAKEVKPGVDLIGKEGPAPDIGSYDGGFNVLVAASDSGGGDVQTYGKRGENLNDVTMLVHVSGDHKRATVISFPRDLTVRIASCPNDKGGNYPSQTNKINVALTYGGLACVVKTVENLTGLDIPYAALTQFQGVVGMSNAIGGVEVCVATAIHDQQIHVDLEPGKHTLVGYEAVQFLRVRYGLGDGSDLGRVSNQQLFLSALVRKVKTPEVLGNPLTVYKLAEAVAGNMDMSKSLSNLSTLAAMAGAVKDINFDDVVFAQYPSATTAAGLVPLEAPANTLIGAIKADQAISLTGKVSAAGGTELAPGSEAGSQSPTPTATANPGAPVVELPSVIQGQTAAQETCTRGQRAGGH